MYLLDTNHCSRIIAGEATAIRYLQMHANTLVSTSVIVQGELIFMAQRSEQQIPNRERVEEFLQGIRIYPIEGETAVLYGDLKAALLRQFGPREKAKRRRITLAQLGFDENDLWIAATAMHHGLTVVSSDTDFMRLQAAKPLAVEQWPPAP